MQLFQIHHSVLAGVPVAMVPGYGPCVDLGSTDHQVRLLGSLNYLLSCPADADIEFRLTRADVGLDVCSSVLGAVLYEDPRTSPCTQCMVLVSYEDEEPRFRKVIARGRVGDYKRVLAIIDAGETVEVHMSPTDETDSKTVFTATWNGSEWEV